MCCRHGPVIHEEVPWKKAKTQSELKKKTTWTTALMWLILLLLQPKKCMVSRALLVRHWFIPRLLLGLRGRTPIWGWWRTTWSQITKSFTSYEFLLQVLIEYSVKELLCWIIFYQSLMKSFNFIRGIMTLWLLWIWFCDSSWAELKILIEHRIRSKKSATI